MKKIGILTFHAAHNYGSCLQNFALQQVLIELGYLPETINLRTEYQKEWYNFYKPIHKMINKKRSLLRLVYLPYTFSLKKKISLFEHFISNELKISKEINNSSDINLLPEYDAYIVGSDQCWNVTANDFDFSYFLDFVRPEKKKISYAVSMGPNPKLVLNADKFLLEKVSKAISCIDAVSVRDETTADVVSSLIGQKQKVKVLPDPTLLLKPEEWGNFIAKDPLVKGDYIFLYTPFYNKQVYNVAKVLSKKIACKVVVSNINTQSMIHFPGFSYHLACGPWEFLNLVKNAKYVVGGSFHLLVFCTLLKKKFLAVNGLNDSRLSSLLKLTGLENYSVAPTDLLDEVLERLEHLDFDFALEKIRQEASIAKCFLKDNLE